MRGGQGRGALGGLSPSFPDPPWWAPWGWDSPLQPLCSLCQVSCDVSAIRCSSPPHVHRSCATHRHVVWGTYVCNTAVSACVLMQVCMHTIHVQCATHTTHMHTLLTACTCACEPHGAFIIQTHVCAQDTYPHIHVHTFFQRGWLLLQPVLPTGSPHTPSFGLPLCQPLIFQSHSPAQRSQPLLQGKGLCLEKWDAFESPLARAGSHAPVSGLARVPCRRIWSPR